MNKRLRTLVLPLLAAGVLSAALAQQQAAPAPPPGQASASGGQSEAKAFSQQELDQLLAPIALYPDNLLAQMLMASTYPLEVVQAARWSAANPDVKGTALQDAMQKQPWDPSVKGLTAVPQVLKQMDENLEWLQKLGDAFLEQQSDVMNTVQALRKKANDTGNLKSTPEMAVKTETAEDKTVYVIESTKTETVYVPTYNPTVVYGAWPYYGYPPYYMYPPAYVYPPGLTFSLGIIVGGAIWGGCGWGGNDVYINHNDFNNFNRNEINNDIGNGNRGDRGDRGDRGNSSWKHNPEHRGGVPYRDKATSDRFDRGGDNRAQARESFRGREQGGGGLDRGSGPGAGTRDLGSRDTGSRNMGGSRDSMGSRDSGSRGSDRGSRGGGGFSGMNSGSSARAASSRGSSSFGGRSGGGFGGGGGRRR